ncbi:MAG: hypothetical protein J7K20_03735 [Thermodesulfobacterium sp.]|nr:hypothetical protein [Thermodesulfobacterium sp.]
MKFNKIFLILLFLIFPSLTFSQLLERDIDKLIKSKEKQLIEIKKKREALEELKKKFLRVYIALYVKGLYKNNVSGMFENPDYLAFFHEKEKLNFIERALIKKILEIKKEEEKLDNLYNKIVKEIKHLKVKRRQVFSLYNLPIKSGNYNFKLEGPAPVLSPVKGVIKKITYRSNNIEIVIKTQNCIVSISKLDEIKVNIGDYVIQKQEIGYINETKNIPVIIKCEEGFFLNSFKNKNL